MKLEVCCCTYADALTALEAGADRVELCSALASGGVTPSLGLMLQVCSTVGKSIPVHVLIRPREGGFVYSPEEVEIMIADIAAARKAGAAGVVIGCLLPSGEIDMENSKRLVEAASGMSVTFSRAFDVAPDLMRALSDVKALGCHRVLTSGGQSSAIKGADAIKALQEAASPVIVLAGAGVNENNFKELIAATGVQEIHGSLRGSEGDNACTSAGVAFDGHHAVSFQKVEKITSEINNIN